MDPVEAGRNCTGTEVKKCLWLHVDPGNGRLRGYAEVRDDAGNPDYEVAVNEIYIEREIPEMLGSRQLIAASYWHDHDGWDGLIDSGATALVNCNLPYRSRVTAQMHWRNAGSNELVGEDEYISRWVDAGRCV
jgi:hypothetical protein